MRALVRGAAPSLDGLAIERVAGDLFSPTLSDAMKGCDVVFHVAAFYSLWRRDRNEVMRVNVEGTRLVLDAARRAGVPRVVHTSSVAAIGVRADGEPASEQYQSEREALVGAYKRSKYDGEVLVQRAVADGQDVVIVNPVDADRAVGCETDADRRDRRALLHRQACRHTWIPGSTSSTCATWRRGTSWPTSADGRASATSSATRT